MHIQVLKECGHSEALLGLSLSFGRPIGEMPQVAEKLYCKDDSESKFLRFIVVWLDITAPRYWWQEFDTYRHIEKQSESTMHTLLKQRLTGKEFEHSIPILIIDLLNDCIECGDLLHAKMYLPESFLQRRIVVTNYQTLRRIIRQRRNHKLNEWQTFIDAILEQIEHREFFSDLKEEEIGDRQQVIPEGRRSQ